MHRTLFTTDYTTSCNQGHFNLKAFSIEFHNNIQRGSHNCSCVSGCPRVVGARMHPPEPLCLPRELAQAAHLSLAIWNVRPKHDSRNSNPGISSVPFLHGSSRWMLPVLCGLCFKLRRCLDPSGHSCFMDFIHGVTCTHIPGTSAGVCSWAWVPGQAGAGARLVSGKAGCRHRETAGKGS